MPPDFDVVVVQYEGKRAVCPGGSLVEDGTTVRYTTIDNKYQYDGDFAVSTIGIHKQRLIAPNENLGWVKGANVGLALSTAPYVVLMNDDVEVKTDGWLELLRSAFNTSPVVGAVAPAKALRAHYHSSRPANSDAPTVFFPNLSLEGFGIGHVPISFWCVMFSRAALEEVGYLDERLGHGYGGDDDDWQARAHLAGWEIAVHPQVDVRHQGQASWGKDRPEAQAKNVKILREMWKERLK